MACRRYRTVRVSGSHAQDTKQISVRMLQQVTLPTLCLTTKSGKNPKTRSTNRDAPSCWFHFVQATRSLRKLQLVSHAPTPSRSPILATTLSGIAYCQRTPDVLRSKLDPLEDGQTPKAFWNGTYASGRLVQNEWQRYSTRLPS